MNFPLATELLHIYILYIYIYIYIYLYLYSAIYKKNTVKEHRKYFFVYI
jgi:hypothetical protein